MTLPILPIPDTRPGYAFQTPGDVGALAQGLQAVIQALMAGREAGQKQQQLDQTGQYYQDIAANQRADREDARAATAQQQANATDLGRALQALLTPASQPVTLPNGLTAPLPVGETPGIGQVAAGLRPELVPEFTKQAGPIVKEQEAAKEKRRQEASRTAFLNALSPEARPAGMALIATRDMGLDDATGRQLFSTVWGQAASPDLLATILRTHPDWAKLPVPEQVALYVDEMRERTEARFRPPPTPDKPDKPSVPTEGERRAAAMYKVGKKGFDTLESVLGKGKGVPGWTPQQLSKAGFGVGNVMTDSEFRQMRQAARLLSDAWLRYTSGAAVPESEVVRFAEGFIPQAGDDPVTLAQKREARQTMIDALKVAAGRGLAEYPEDPYR